MNHLGERKDPREEWCRENLYHGGYYEPKWHIVYGMSSNTYCFQDEKEYLHFLLVWQ
jgi:hypothetical protein